MDAAVEEIPRLSPYIAKEIILRTPLHAWQKHRLLGGGDKGTKTDATMDGLIYEDLIFGLGKIQVIPFDDYKKQAAKDARDEVLAAKGIPVKQTDYAIYAESAMAMLTNINKGGAVFEGGAAQKKIFWLSEGANCDGVLDYVIIGENFYIIYDLKCVEDASNDAMSRSIAAYGWDIQAAAYVEAVETKRPDLAGKGQYILVACEKDKPYAVNACQLSGAYTAIGNMKWQKAKSIWTRCLASGIWPGYPEKSYIEPTAWQLKAAEKLEAA